MKSLMIMALLISSTVSAQDLEIKTARLGINEAALKSIFPNIRCRPNDSFIGDVLCAELTSSYGGASASLLAALVGDSTISITAYLKPKDFDSVVTAITSKYGPPDENRPSTLTTRMGAKFENLEVAWKRGDEVLRATRFVGSIDQSSVALISGKTLQHFLQRKKEETGSRAKDL